MIDHDAMSEIEYRTNLRAIGDYLDNLPMWARDLAGKLRNGAKVYVPLGGSLESLTPENCAFLVTALEAISDHDRRVTELLAANNRYQQEARDARAQAREAFDALRSIAKLVTTRMKDTANELASR